ncbi:MAG TPA: SsrA-binding protein SmpB [Phycisphaerae bacterium]|nr:SsrA-binding protein SmpB [Phycisphaerae bacterium]
MVKQASPAPPRIINKKARFNYEIIERVEVGIMLRGSEVKSVRNGQVSLEEAFARIDAGEVFLYGCHISPYEQAGSQNHDPARPRKLLLHRREIKRLIGRVREKGQTLVPLGLYFNSRGLAKVDLALAKGKRSYDKREHIRKRDQERDMARALGG